MNDNSSPTKPGRRRLAKGGLAVPVVLASLTTKNAFAALPYNCFLSGKLSNNMSPFGPAGRTTSRSCALPSNRTQVQSNLRDDLTTFSSVFGIDIYVNANGKLSPNAGGSTPRPLATLYQMLTKESAGPNPVPNLLTLQQAIVVYRNAVAFPPPNDMVPLTTTQVIALAQAVNRGGSYTYTDGASMATKTFTTPQIVAYFAELSA